MRSETEITYCAAMFGHQMVSEDRTRLRQVCRLVCSPSFPALSSWVQGDEDLDGLHRNFLLVGWR